jgi:hypothetical protein
MKTVLRAKDWIIGVNEFDFASLGIEGNNIFDSVHRTLDERAHLPGVRHDFVRNLFGYVFAIKFRTDFKFDAGLGNERQTGKNER